MQVGSEQAFSAEVLQRTIRLRAGGKKPGGGTGHLQTKRAAGQLGPRAKMASLLLARGGSTERSEGTVAIRSCLAALLLFRPRTL